MIQEIIAYLKKPDSDTSSNYFRDNKWTLFLVIFVAAIIINIALSFVIGIIDAMELINTDKHAVMEMIKELPFWLSVIAAVVFAPFFEELIFRAPITLFKDTSPQVFRIVFYAFAVAFGLIHISNYDVNPTTILLSPILCAPQIIIGLFLGLIRVKVGYWYAVLYHAMYNAVLIIPALIYYKYLVTS